jgi:hypothetical protein
MPLDVAQVNLVKLKSNVVMSALVCDRWAQASLTVLSLHAGPFSEPKGTECMSSGFSC